MMNEDTAKPSNEGSGKRIAGREMKVEHVADEDVTRAYIDNGYDDLRVVSADPLIIDPARENAVNGTSGNNSNAGGIIKVEKTAEQTLEEIKNGNYVEMPAKPQTEKEKSKRRDAKARNVKKSRTDKDDLSK